MTRRSQWVISGLAGWLLLLSGLVYPQLAAHAAEHAHHATSTHATALCTWLCAAGQTAEDVAPPALSRAEIVFRASSPEWTVPSSSWVVITYSRGPPTR